MAKSRGKTGGPSEPPATLPLARVDPADQLFSLPLTGFTAARNALVAALRKEGRGEDAERVRQLGRPALSAWAVNQIFWHERPLYDRLLAAGDRFRIAQQDQLVGRAGDLRGALEARREVLSTATTAAASRLRAAGHTPTPDTMRRITTTLDALATWGVGPGAPNHGRLIADVAPPGFEALAALVPRVGAESQKSHGARRILSFDKRPDPDKQLSPEEEARQREALRKADRAHLKVALRKAERQLEKAKTSAAKAEQALKKAAALARQTEKEAATAAALAEKATASAETARTEARRVAAEAEMAAQAVDDAEREVARVKQAAREV